MLDTVNDTGESICVNDQPLLLEDKGMLRETYFTWSYNPIYHKSRVEGVITNAFETTMNVINGRRIKYMRDMGAHATEAVGIDDAFKIIAKSLTNAMLDVPFASLYHVHSATKDTSFKINLKETIEISAGTPLSPFKIDNMSVQDTQSKLTISTVLESITMGSPRILELTSYDVPICSAWNARPKQAIILPIKSQEETRAVLIAGLNPHAYFDETYQSFFQLLASQIGSILSNVLAREEERKRAEKLAEIDRAKTEFFSMSVILNHFYCETNVIW